jgi:hypothetical protein
VVVLLARKLYFSVLCFSEQLFIVNEVVVDKFHSLGILYKISAGSRCRPICLRLTHGNKLKS